MVFEVCLFKRLPSQAGTLFLYTKSLNFRENVTALFRNYVDSTANRTRIIDPHATICCVTRLKVCCLR